MHDISIRTVRPATIDKWDLIWRDCDYSTYFHSREWAEIWNVYTKGKMHPDPRLIFFSDGKEAMLPLSVQKGHKGLIKNYISSPAGTFGGWISADELGISHLQVLTEYLTMKCHNLYWRLNPYDELLVHVGVSLSEYDETQTLSLSDGFDSVCRSWTKGHSSAVHKAYRSGLSTKVASTLDHWHSYYLLYEDSLRRWGDKASSKYSWELFEEIFRRASPNVKLWLAIYNEIVVAGALCFYAKKHAVYWHGAALDKYFNLRPVHLLMYEAIKHACDMGYNWFDFNPSGGHVGVKAFKKSFGAVGMPSPVLYRNSKTMYILDGVTKLIRKI
jgi:hypothetical protein